LNLGIGRGFWNVKDFVMLKFFSMVTIKIFFLHLDMEGRMFERPRSTASH